MVVALAKVCKAVQVLAFAIFKLRAEVPPKEIGEVPIVIEPELVRAIVEFVKEVLAIVEEAKSHLLLKVVQFAAERHPATEPEAAAQVRIEFVPPILATGLSKDRGAVAVKVVVATLANWLAEEK